MNLALNEDKFSDTCQDTPNLENCAFNWYQTEDKIETAFLSKYFTMKPDQQTQRKRCLVTRAKNVDGKMELELARCTNAITNAVCKKNLNK